LGYTIAPDDLLHAHAATEGQSRLRLTNVAQHIALETFTTGYYYTHVELLKKSYRIKRDAMLASLLRFMPRDPGSIGPLQPAGCMCG